MSLPTIKRYLSLDVDDLDPADVSAANSEAWPSASDVADYAYKSLATIWLISGVTTSAELASTIKYKKGEIADNARQEIILLHLPQDSYNYPKGDMNNNPGSLEYDMEILYRLPANREDYDRLFNTSIRVRYLLDHRWRARRRARPNHLSLDPQVDKSLDGGIICQWVGYVFPPNGQEFVERWKVRQDIVVPR